MSSSSSSVITQLPVGVSIIDSLTKDNNVYYLAHWNNCNQDSSSEIKKFRGVIMTSAGEIVCKTFGWTSEYLDNSPDIKQVIDSLWDDIEIITVSHEGTILRVWCHDNYWHISSHRKIDAGQSYWGCGRSHSDMLLDALTEHYSSIGVYSENVWELFTQELNPDRVYSFLVPSTAENRIVVSVPHPLMYVAEFDKLGNMMDENTSNILMAQDMYFSNSADVINYVKNNSPLKTQGVVIYTKSDECDKKVIKITSSRYTELAELRGNQSNLNYRYLQLRNTDKFAPFLDLYKERASHFEYLELTYQRLINRMLEYYVKSYVNRELIFIPPRIWRVLQDINTDIKAEPITRKIVIEYLDKEPVQRLYKTLKDF